MISKGEGPLQELPEGSNRGRTDPQADAREYRTGGFNLLRLAMVGVTFVFLVVGWSL